MAISFIFDLDGFLYPLLLRVRDRDRYERRQSAAERAMIGASTRTHAMVHYLSWIVCFVDVLSIMDLWAACRFHRHYDGIYGVTLGRDFRNYMYLRGGAMGLVVLVLALRRQLARRSPAIWRARLGLQLLLQATVSFCCCLFNYALVHHFLSRYFGYRHDVVRYPDLFTLDSSEADDAQYAPGSGSLIHQCLKNIAQNCQLIHLSVDWDALSDFVCNVKGDCPSSMGLFDHR